MFETFFEFFQILALPSLLHCYHKHNEVKLYESKVTLVSSVTDRIPHTHTWKRNSVNCGHFGYLTV